MFWASCQPFIAEVLKNHLVNQVGESGIVVQIDKMHISRNNCNHCFSLTANLEVKNFDVNNKLRKKVCAELCLTMI